MFREPTTGDLKSACGWTLLRRTSTTPEHVVALDKYRDGCESLIPFANDGAAEVDQRGDVKLPAQVSPPLPLVSVREPVAAEPAFLQHAGLVSCHDGGAHRFNIDSRKCAFCGQTRKEALGRQPELMTP